MDFREFQSTNALRCEERFHRVKDWTPQDWALAMAGEVGELCNLLKKVKRGDFSMEEVRDEVLKEVADVITYADLLNSCLDADTETELVSKFNEVSRRVGWGIPTIEI